MPRARTLLRRVRSLEHSSTHTRAGESGGSIGDYDSPIAWRCRRIAWRERCDLYRALDERRLA
jgi:hypothetical protein